jgi:hypothetical protein
MHIDVERLKALMMSTEKLTEHEEDHLMQCQECKESMVEATLKQLQAEKDTQKR